MRKGQKMSFETLWAKYETGKLSLAEVQAWAADNGIDLASLPKPEHKRALYTPRGRLGIQGEMPKQSEAETLRILATYDRKEEPKK
jgi:hypothetical protein